MAKKEDLSIYENALTSIIILIESEFEIMAGSKKRKTSLINWEIKKLVSMAWKDAVVGEHKRTHLKRILREID